ncbi:hypothetical protein CspeluHIS016_0601680 [Cutaneotrichosporon spelunceum]|uniref:Uncharacterized protein n=1 Tax=Cutaneotrichosporon spelunceum TaxID=1672016 RepID=A0AAD3TY80_9TREE|nr:hypothetical protein CspeluHIS016_0601680 [Cutaneotrichosporon spelunceum]
MEDMSCSTFLQEISTASSNTPYCIIMSLSRRTVLQHFSFGLPVLDALNRALPILAPNFEPYVFNAAGAHKPLPAWKHLLVLQVPSSAAWEATCHDLSERMAPFVGFTKLPAFPGNEGVPPPSEMLAPARAGVYDAKCTPDTMAVITRARRMRKNHPILRAIYLVTDSQERADELAHWLHTDGWDAVYVASDVHNAWRDLEIRSMVETEVCRRAGVFVGSGFTTMASNVALLRTRDLVPPDFTQFW